MYCAHRETPKYNFTSEKDWVLYSELLQVILNRIFLGY
jgi:hypothetical protein